MECLQVLHYLGFHVDNRLLPARYGLLFNSQLQASLIRPIVALPSLEVGFVPVPDFAILGDRDHSSLLGLGVAIVRDQPRPMVADIHRIRCLSAYTANCAPAD